MRTTRESTAGSRTVRPGVDPGAESLEEATRDVVGWTMQAEFRHSRRLSADVTRKVLATALGLEPEALAGVAAAHLRTALDRLRGMAAFTHKLAEMAATDDLTGALRRTAGLEALQREIDRSRRMGDDGIVVVFLDIDALRQVNDSEGHAAGDRLLVDVVGAIRKRIRSYDLVIRYGGDEFVFALIHMTMTDAERTLADIRRQYAARTRHTFSAGLTVVGGEDTATSVVAKADAALYQARRALEA